MTYWYVFWFFHFLPIKVNITRDYFNITRDYFIGMNLNIDKFWSWLIGKILWSFFRPFLIRTNKIWLHFLYWVPMNARNVLLCSFFRWDTHFYMSLFPSVRPSVHCTPYLRNRTSSNHKFWYTHVKWWHL